MKQIKIYFDSGCRGNPGAKYGSYEVRIEGKQLLRQTRVEFGHGTNNEAEFNTLELALSHTILWLQEQGIDPANYQVTIETDSTMVQHRLMVKNRVHKKPKLVEGSQRMFEHANRCLVLLTKFHVFYVIWEGRKTKVLRFYHVLFLLGILNLLGCSAPTKEPPLPVSFQPLIQNSPAPVQREWLIPIEYPTNASQFKGWYLQGSGDNRNWTNIQFYGPWTGQGSNAEVTIPKGGIIFWRMKGVNP